MINISNYLPTLLHKVSFPTHKASPKLMKGHQFFYDLDWFVS